MTSVNMSFTITTLHDLVAFHSAKSPTLHPLQKTCV